MKKLFFLALLFVLGIARMIREAWVLIVEQKYGSLQP